MTVPPISANKANSGLTALCQDAIQQARFVCDQAASPQVVVSPYRVNPLGAHVDHQGGAVLARTIDQYTLLVFWPADRIELHAAMADDQPPLSLSLASLASSDAIPAENWQRYAVAAFQVLSQHASVTSGLIGRVTGTMVGSGLSSSASVVLAYLMAMATVNDISLSQAELVELSRQVENNHLGLRNGVQDQMSIVFGHSNGLVRLAVDERTVELVADPPSADDVAWVLCHSGYSRELIYSGFNTRVDECRAAAALLDPHASRLCDVPVNKRHEHHLDELPVELSRRARHVYGEIQRVDEGCDAWRRGDWSAFGKLMNASCASSINLYESGSQALVDLHQMATDLPGVYGSRFGGGGYGGCLIVLARASDAAGVAQGLLTQYLAAYPDREGLAKAFIATPEEHVRVARDSQLA